MAIYPQGRSICHDPLCVRAYTHSSIECADGSRPRGNMEPTPRNRSVDEWDLYRMSQNQMNLTWGVDWASGINTQSFNCIKSTGVTNLSTPVDLTSNKKQKERKNNVRDLIAYYYRSRR